jgi:hypothetical protein
MFRSGSASAGGAATAKRIKEWVRAELPPDADVTILVSELTCSEPGCPPVETVIALFRGSDPAVKFKIHRPLAEVTREEIASLQLAQARST